MGFVGPQNKEIVVFTLFLWPVEAAQDVRVEEHFQERVHVPTFGLELLRHGDADDLASVDVTELEGVVAGTKDLRDVRRQKIMQIVGDGLLHAAHLLGWLGEVAVLEMLHERAAAFGRIAFRQLL